MANMLPFESNFVLKTDSGVDPFFLDQNKGETTTSSILKRPYIPLVFQIISNRIHSVIVNDFPKSDTNLSFKKFSMCNYEFTLNSLLLLW